MRRYGILGLASWSATKMCFIHVPRKFKWIQLGSKERSWKYYFSSHSATSWVVWQLTLSSFFHMHDQFSCGKLGSLQKANHNNHIIYWLHFYRNHTMVQHFPTMVNRKKLDTIPFDTVFYQKYATFSWKNLVQLGKKCQGYNSIKNNSSHLDSGSRCWSTDGMAYNAACCVNANWLIYLFLFERSGVTFAFLIVGATYFIIRNINQTVSCDMKNLL